MITRIIGGGESWLYLVIDDRIIDAAHQDDAISMARLRKRLRGSV